jgi:hypothetical protein
VLPDPGADPDRGRRGAQRRDVDGGAALRLRRLVAHRALDPAQQLDARENRTRRCAVSVDESALAQLRSTLAADDYAIEVDQDGEAVTARITAGPSACEDCLVPKPLMRGVLQNALGVPQERIELVYPGES